MSSTTPQAPLTCGASLLPTDRSPSIRSLLLQDLTRRRERGEDIASRKLSAVLAREYNCSRALVIAARRTVLACGHTQAFDDLRSAFGGGMSHEAA